MIDFANTFMLSRIQFAANTTFHIIFPSLTIGLAWYLFFFRVRYNKTKDAKWFDAYRFFVKIFALTFAVGVVSGMTMVFQFGTNWPGFMEKVGNVAGPLLGYEVLTAFFLEASFLAVMLFGMNKVSQRVHTISVFLVAAGTTLSGFWILVLNSWMQTPAGFEMINGVAHVTSWLHVIFNPSMLFRFSHMILAALISAAFLILGLSSFRYLRQDRKEDVIMALKTALIAASILLPIQVIVGDQLGLNTLHHQPAKIAAIEGIWETKPANTGEALHLFAIPDDAAHKNLFSVKVPHLGSVILTHTWNGTIKGIDSFKDHPPVFPVFWSFRIMVGLGLLMMLLAWSGAYVIKKRAQELPALYLKTLVATTFAGCLATIFGWYVSEIGRQPFIVYHVLRTADAVTKIPPSMVFTSLMVYVITYLLVFTAYVSTIFYMASHARETLNQK